MKLAMREQSRGCNSRHVLEFKEAESPSTTPGGVLSLLSQLPSPLGAFSCHFLEWESSRPELESSLCGTLAVCV